LSLSKPIQAPCCPHSYSLFSPTLFSSSRQRARSVTAPLPLHTTAAPREPSWCMMCRTKRALKTPKTRGWSSCKKLLTTTPLSSNARCSWATKQVKNCLLEGTFEYVHTWAKSNALITYCFMNFISYSLLTLHCFLGLRLIAAVRLLLCCCRGYCYFHGLMFCRWFSSDIAGSFVIANKYLRDVRVLDLTPVVNEAEHVASVKSLGLTLSARTSAKTGDGVNQVIVTSVYTAMLAYFPLLGGNCIDV